MALLRPGLSKDSNMHSYPLSSSSIRLLLSAKGCRLLLYRFGTLFLWDDGFSDESEVTPNYFSLLLTLLSEEFM